MVIASDLKTFIEIDNTWADQDIKQRLLSIDKLDTQIESNRKFLVQVAHKDEHEEVRCGAIRKITDFSELEKLQKSNGIIKENAIQQAYRILAGNVESGLTDKERTEKILTLTVLAAKRIALITKSKFVAGNALERIEQAEDLADLCLYAVSVHVRKSAALKITDQKLLKEIQSKVEGKDKTVSKLIALRLSTDGVNENSSGSDKAIEVKITSPKKNKPVKKRNTNTSEQATEKIAVLEPALEFSAIEEEAHKLSYKNTTRLYELRAQLGKLLNRIPDAESELTGQTKGLQADISKKIDLNNEYQKQLQNKTEQLLSVLAEALESGSSERAIQSWDKIQGNISNAANQVRSSLQKQADTYRAKLTELRDWKIFAAAEKKKELISQMQHLIESRMHASDRSKHISKMHKEWKLLGHSNQNEILWKQFKKYSDLAYELCKDYFKQKKQLMARNLLRRREICEALELELKNMSDDGTSISLINKILNKSEQDWKRYTPIEQSKVKGIQKRFYATVKQLRKIRKIAVTTNARQKQELVIQAKALASLEDNKKAMSEAKRLQQEWKKAGPGSYKEDNKHWHEFRAACDTIFSKRDKESEELQAELKLAETKLMALLRSLSDLLNKDEDSFREARTNYQDLTQEFSNSLDPRLKSQRKRLLDQFNTVKRQIDIRYRSLPDKRQLLLKNSIVAKTKILRRLEELMLNANDQTTIEACKKTVDRAVWTKIGASGALELDKKLEHRLQMALETKSAGALAERLSLSEKEFRALCIKAEIRANIETPVEDKPLRMKIQLEQLQSGFGQAKPEQKENIKYALEIELESYTIGPLESTTREQLASRLGKTLQKLK